MGQGKVRFNHERCKGCELCISVCPQKILRLSDKQNSFGVMYPECFNPEKCTGCKLCAMMCPDSVISVQKECKTGEANE